MPIPRVGPVAQPVRLFTMFSQGVAAIGKVRTTEG